MVVPVLGCRDGRAVWARLGRIRTGRVISRTPLSRKICPFLWNCFLFILVSLLWDGRDFTKYKM